MKDAMQLMMKFRSALTGAQLRTGDETLSACVEKGRVKICRVTYDAKGMSTIESITDYLPPSEALEFINAL